ncbi:MAG: alcohol dehydrogenase catalytic domain-containing protein, partial [Chloroflexi bacterium]|nr:alcohol dehydrogenase catalytic domain-containing protein [Chloroflexota bacterium]
MRIVQAARPVPGPGEVLLRIRAVGICGSDLHYYKEGGIGDAVVNEPLIIGHEFAAEVAELGPGVTGLFVGQPVAVEPAMPCHHCELCVEGNSNLCPSVRFAGSPGVQGAMREYMVHPAANCFPLLPGMTFADGAVLEPLGIGIHAVDLGKQKVGATVAVLGCGPIGLLTMQVARAAGASRIFATDLLDYRLEAAKKCGAT